MMPLFRVILTVALLLNISACAFAKVTDPKSPKFDVTQFTFEDYNDPQSFHDVMKVLFPVGTSRTRIEGILVKFGQAEIHDSRNVYFQGKKISENERIVIYTKVDKSAVRVTCKFIFKALYNENESMLNAIPNYGCL